MIRYPDALQRSALLGGRYELQTKQTYERQDIFVTVTEQFNSSANSGGLVTNHEEYTERNIDSEAKNTSGEIKPKQPYDIFKTTIKAYALCLTKFEASGKHNSHDFYNYCQGDIDVLYLFHSLE